MAQPIDLLHCGQQTVFRLKEHQGGFLMIDNETTQDAGLSAEALGVLVHCLSRPPDWNFNTTNLCSSFQRLGRDKLGRILKELQAKGFAYLATIQAPDGKFQGRRWMFFETPRLNPWCCPQCLAESDNRNPEKPNFGKNRKSEYPKVEKTTSIQRTKLTPKTETKTNNNTSGHIEPQEKRLMVELVKRGVSSNTAEKLVNEFGVRRVREVLDAGHERGVTAGWYVDALRNGWGFSPKSGTELLTYQEALKRMGTSKFHERFETVRKRKDGKVFFREKSMWT